MSTADFVFLMVVVSTIGGGVVGWLGAHLIMNELARRERRRRARATWSQAWRNPR